VRPIPPATAARLPAYRQALVAAAAEGVRVMPSAALAARLGLHPDQVRRDLSHLATRGTRWVRYLVADLVVELSGLLGLTVERAVVLVGAGNLGRALAAHDGFTPRGFRLVAVVDVDPAVVGTDVGGLTVSHLRRLPVLVRRHDGALGVVAVPAASAQAVVDALVAAGIGAILNFAPTRVRVPPDVAVRHVDLSGELQMLGFARARAERGAAPARGATRRAAAGPAAAGRAAGAA